MDSGSATTSDFSSVLLLDLREARFLRLMLEGDMRTSDEVRARRLIVKMIDAIMFLRRNPSESYAMRVTEPDLWMLDLFVKELSKDPWEGKAMTDLVEKVWTLLHQIPQYSADLFEDTLPDAATDGDDSFRAAVLKKDFDNA